jgi:hypothetical protein
LKKIILVLSICSIVWFLITNACTKSIDFSNLKELSIEYVKFKEDKNKDKYVSYYVLPIIIGVNKKGQGEEKIIPILPKVKYQSMTAFMQDKKILDDAKDLGLSQITYSFYVLAESDFTSKPLKQINKEISSGTVNIAGDFIKVPGLSVLTGSAIDIGNDFDNFWNNRPKILVTSIVLDEMNQIYKSENQEELMMYFGDIAYTPEDAIEEYLLQVEGGKYFEDVNEARDLKQLKEDLSKLTEWEYRDQTNGSLASILDVKSAGKLIVNLPSNVLNNTIPIPFTSAFPSYDTKTKIIIKKETKQ